MDVILLRVDREGGVCLVVVENAHEGRFLLSNGECLEFSDLQLWGR